MSTTSFGGLVSGLDTETIVAQLMSIESRPLYALEDKKEAQTKLLTIYSDARTKLSAIQTAAKALDTRAEFKKMSATTGDEDIFTVTADADADAGTHQLKVTALAQAEMEVSQGFSSKTASVGAGTFSITVGDVETEVTLGEGYDTLEGLRDAINDSDAEVNATIINDGDASNPYRLVITANETGTANAITIDASGLAGGTLPAFTDGSVEGEPGQQAADATMILDGVSITKGSNTVDDLLDGVTINLKDVDDTKAVSLTIESNADEVAELVEAFVTAYNDFHNWVEAKDDEGSLKGDSSLRSIDRQIRSTLISSIDGLEDQTYRAMSQVGVAFTRDGVLAIDTEAFTDALEENYDEVMNIFASHATASSPYVSVQSVSKYTEPGTYSISVSDIGASFAAMINGHSATTYSSTTFVGASGYDEEGLLLRFSGSTTGDYGNVTVGLGLMDLIDRQINTYTDTTDGTLKSRTESINSSIRSLESRIERKEAQLDRVEERLNAQFTQMEITLQQMQMQSSALSAFSF